jgi:C-terminal processing protease CtpA/Prc
MLPSEAVKHIRGPANSVVELMVQKYGVGEERKLSLTRRKINIPSVREEILTGVTQTGNIGYIDLSIF